VYEQYAGFVGFSFGGGILQQCLPLFSTAPKPMILFSTPTFADTPLREKLGSVIHLCQQDKVEPALQVLYTHVYSPQSLPSLSYSNENHEHIARRLIFGLTRVLTMDSTPMIRHSEVNQLHLIGECSDLVNRANVLPPARGHLWSVPGSGMRVLEDNGAFCEKKIREFLQRAG
jgi:hypothetical protein